MATFEGVVNSLERESKPVTCGGCKFFADSRVLIGKEKITCGECRRHAPVIQKFTPTWPSMCSDGWCGDWEKRAL